MSACLHPSEYFCPLAGENECPACSAFDICCDQPSVHQPPVRDPLEGIPPWDGIENINSYLERHDICGEGFTY
jgi:hypothetical protein